MKEKTFKCDVDWNAMRMEEGVVEEARPTVDLTPSFSFEVYEEFFGDGNVGFGLDTIDDITTGGQSQKIGKNV